MGNGSHLLHRRKVKVFYLWSLNPGIRNRDFPARIQQQTWRVQAGMGGRDPEAASAGAQRAQQCGRISLHSVCRGGAGKALQFSLAERSGWCLRITQSHPYSRNECGSPRPPGLRELPGRSEVCGTGVRRPHSKSRGRGPSGHFLA